MTGREVMRRLAWVILWPLLSGVVALAADTNELTRAVSASRQFVAYAPGPLLPQALCVFADQVQREWRYRLDLAEPGRDPILIVVRPRRPADTGRTTPTVGVFATDLHLKYQITWPTPPAIEPRGLVRALVEALCGELANRHQLVPREGGYVPAPIPPWLSAGLARAVRGREERLLQLARRSLAGGRPMTADSLLTTAELPVDPLALDLFEANTGLLVEGLLGLPRGAAKLTRYILLLGETKSAPQAFAAVYNADFPEPDSLEKWWAVELSRRTELITAQALTAQATQAMLAKIVATELAVTNAAQPALTQETVPFEDLWRYYQKRWLDRTIADKLNKLDSLEIQAFPNYRPVIAAYRTALGWLRERKLNRFRRAAAEAVAQQRTVEQQARAIRDYLDEMELVHSPLLLDSHFDSFFQTFENLDTLEQQRRSPISEYLDRFEP